MIKTNADEVAKSLDDYKKEVERKLKAMVVGFAQDVASAASDATRVGHISEGGNTLNYINKYKQRALPPSQGGYGIEAIEGYHRGAWQYTEGELQFNPVIYDKATMLDTVDLKAEVNYKIGDTFTVGAIGPAYEMLQELDDIDGATISTVMGAHRSDLETYYNQG